MQNDTSKLKIIFMGSPEIGATILADLLKQGINIKAVITRPDRPCGRNRTIEQTPVKIMAQEHKITVYQPNDKAELTEVIKKIQPELCIVAAYGMMIPDEALNIPKYGMINFHPSLLPELRGPSPIPMAIMCGHKKTGVSIIQISSKMDAGDILAQKEIVLKGDETTPSLSKNLADIGSEMIVALLPQIENNILKPIPQDEAKATYSHILKKTDGEIIFQKYHAQNIEQAARAFTPWPGIYTNWDGKKIELFEPKVIKGNFEPGVVKVEDDKIIIGTAKDGIAPAFFKIEGKNKQSAKEFLCGYRNFIGSKLE